MRAERAGEPNQVIATFEIGRAAPTLISHVGERESTWDE